jgi:hypothetical protein
MTDRPLFTDPVDTDEYIKPSGEGMAALRAERDAAHDDWREAVDQRDAARAQIAAALAIEIPTDGRGDHCNFYWIRGYQAAHDLFRRALTGETP